jgi:hypothetical protein
VSKIDTENPFEGFSVSVKFVIVRERVSANNGQNCKRLSKLLCYKEYEQRKYID